MDGRGMWVCVEKGGRWEGWEQGGRGKKERKNEVEDYVYSFAMRDLKWVWSSNLTFKLASSYLCAQIQTASYGNQRVAV